MPGTGQNPASQPPPGAPAHAGPDGGPVRPVVFLHLPKTAGMTIRTMLERAYAGHPIQLIGGSGGEGGGLSLAAFARRPLAERRKIALIAGHMPWGAQAAIPGSRAITVLRDPVERVISFFYFSKRAPNAVYHRAINEQGLTLRDAVESGMLTAEYNLQTNMLRDQLATGAAAALRSAKRNIRACAAFGIVERFDESAAYLARELRWPETSWETKNVTRNRPRADDLEPDLLERLRHETGVDRMLYDDAVALFNRRTGG